MRNVELYVRNKEGNKEGKQRDKQVGPPGLTVERNIIEENC
jgi:hypothetical protein